MAIGLYPQVLGAAWSHLHEAVRRLHCESVPLQATGCLHIRHGKGRMARWLTCLLGLPEAAEAVPTRLAISPCGDGEKWSRTFGERPLVTMQCPGGPGILAERFGPFDVRFRLYVQGGALVYQQTSVALRLGVISIPLPGWLAPKVTASEEAAEELNRTHVSVRIDIPYEGLLISYDGFMVRDGAS